MSYTTTTLRLKYPWDPPTPQTAHSTCSIFLPPPHQTLPFTTTTKTPLTAHSTCSIFNPGTPSDGAWMWARCTLGLGTVVPQLAGIPASRNGRRRRMRKGGEEETGMEKETETKKKKRCGGWGVYHASLPLREKTSHSIPTPEPPGSNPNRKVLAARMKELLLRRVAAASSHVPFSTGINAGAKLQF
ncbi:hypothetical protein LOZ42_006368 [Ophidiomyces ophidiicola]|nr:hypothetical protein LOZ42_006368 [Ophidiomyces ophidiicola]